MPKVGRVVVSLTHSPTGSIPVNPVSLIFLALAMSTDGTRLFVATGFQGQVLVMNPTSLALLDTVELGGAFALEIAYADVAPSDVIFANTVEG